MKKGEGKTSEAFQRWKYVFAVGESLVGENEAKQAELLEYLESIQEAFKDHCDPVDHFEAYALMQFCRGLRDVLNKQKAASAAVK